MLNRHKYVALSLLSAVAFSLPALGLAASGQRGPAQAKKAPAQGEEVFPHMDPALSLLRQAKTKLQEANPKFYGHREKALAEVNAAINDVQEAINRYVQTHPGARRNEVPTVSVPSEAGDPFPEMHAALNLLNRALGHLNQAAHIYYSKRADAVTHTKAAIAEIKLGIDEYSAKHPTAKNAKKK